MAVEDRFVKTDRAMAMTKVGEETVIFDDENGAYVSLSEVGTVIFDQLKAPQSVSALVDHLLTTYDVDRDTCQKEVMSFLDDMLKANLISSL